MKNTHQTKITVIEWPSQIFNQSRFRMCPRIGLFIRRHQRLQLPPNLFFKWPACPFLLKNEHDFEGQPLSWVSSLMSVSPLSNLVPSGGGPSHWSQPMCRWHILLYCNLPLSKKGKGSELKEHMSDWYLDEELEVEATTMATGQGC